jgi:hypothetical protein
MPWSTMVVQPVFAPAERRSVTANSSGSGSGLDPWGWGTAAGPPDCATPAAAVAAGIVGGCYNGSNGTAWCVVPVGKKQRLRMANLL